MAALKELTKEGRYIQAGEYQRKVFRGQVIPDVEDEHSGGNVLIFYTNLKYKEIKGGAANKKRDRIHIGPSLICATDVSFRNACPQPDPDIFVLEIRPLSRPAARRSSR